MSSPTYLRGQETRVALGAPRRARGGPDAAPPAAAAPGRTTCSRADPRLRPQGPGAQKPVSDQSPDDPAQASPVWTAAPPVRRQRGATAGIARPSLGPSAGRVHARPPRPPRSGTGAQSHSLADEGAHGDVLQGPHAPAHALRAVELQPRPGKQGLCSPPRPRPRPSGPDTADGAPPHMRPIGPGAPPEWPTAPVVFTPQEPPVNAGDTDPGPLCASASSPVTRRPPWAGPLGHREPQTGYASAKRRLQGGSAWQRHRRGGPSPAARATGTPRAHRHAWGPSRRWACLPSPQSLPATHSGRGRRAGQGGLQGRRCARPEGPTQLRGAGQARGLQGRGHRRASLPRLGDQGSGLLGRSAPEHRLGVATGEPGCTGYSGHRRQVWVWGRSHTRPRSPLRLQPLSPRPQSRACARGKRTCRYAHL